MLSTPAFHHLHLNSVNPDAAIDFYTRQFSSTAKTTWSGLPALKSPNNVLILFDKVNATPLTTPQTAFWHFGWHVTDSRKSLEIYQSRTEVKLLPLYTSEAGGSVLISSDTWPGMDGTLGLTNAQVARAQATGAKAAGGAGFAYMEGPDNALVEYAGDYPQERFNHIHLYEEEVFCAQLWYQKHLNAPVMPGRESPATMTEANCHVERGPDRTWPALNREGMFRTPRAAVMFGDVALTWYPRQGDEPLAGTRGQLMDHIAFSVADLDAWMAKLKGEGVTFLEGPYRIGDTRAIMIEGPSREVLELIEVDCNP